MTPLRISAWCAAIFLAANLFPHTVALRLTALALGLALAVFGLLRANVAEGPGRIRALPPLLVPILLWAGWAALSIKWSIEPDRSIKEFKNEVGYVFLAYWLCWICAQTPEARRTFGYLIGAGAVLASVIGIYGYLTPQAPLWLLRFASGAGDQSCALLTLMPLALIGAGLARNKGTPLIAQLGLWILPPLILAAAYATLNRIVWAGFAAELLVMGALLFSRPEFSFLVRSGRARALAGITAVAILGGAAFLVLHVQETRFGDALTPAVVEKDPRMAVWGVALDRIKEHPAKGLGFGKGIDRETLHDEFDNPLLWHAHNLILETAVDTGIPGAALLLLLICATAYGAWRAARNTDLTTAAYGTALLAVVAGMFVRNMVDTVLIRQNALFYWGVVGLLLGLIAARGSRTETHGPSSS